MPDRARTDLWEVRHEATDEPVMTDQSGHNPVYDHRYPTKTCGRSNLAVRSSWDKVTSPQRVVEAPARELDDYQRQGGRGPGWMAWLTQVNC